MPFLFVSLVAFIFAFVGSIPLAGPVSVMVVSRAARREYREAFRLALGAAVAEGGYAGLAFWGFATFLARHQIVLPISHAVSAVVLIALGAYFVHWKHHDAKEKEKNGRRSGFWVGLTISTLNPTLLITWSAVVAAIYARQLVRLDPLLAIPFGVFGAAGVAGWNAVLVRILEKLGGKVPEKLLTWVVRGMGLLLLTIGVWSAVGLVLYLKNPAAHPIR
jgi:threonine/homoserine/homoserine lactone efflux protein